MFNLGPFTYKKNIVVVACFKNEARYIQEWIEYHLILGVEHFYLYNDGSTDNWEEKLSTYIEDEVVTVHDWPHRPVQPDCYNHFLKLYGNEVHWAAIIDCDEFIALKNETSLGSLLLEYEAYSGLACAWACFGSNGHTERAEGLLVDNYTTRQRLSSETWRKNIVQPRFIETFKGPHTLKCKKRPHSGWTVSQHHIRIPDNKFKMEGEDFSKIRIFHYVTKSESEHREKLRRGCAETKCATYRTHPNGTNWGKQQLEYKKLCVFPENHLKKFSEEIRSRIDQRSIV